MTQVMIKTQNSKLSFLLALDEILFSQRFNFLAGHFFPGHVWIHVSADSGACGLQLQSITL